MSLFELGLDANFVIKNEHWDQRMEDLLFQAAEGPKDPITYIQDDTDMFNLLVTMGVFTSRGECRRNWKKTAQRIPDGFTFLQKLGKKNVQFAVWRPIP